MCKQIDCFQPDYDIHEERIVGWLGPKLEEVITHEKRKLGESDRRIVDDAISQMFPCENIEELIIKFKSNPSFVTEKALDLLIGEPLQWTPYLDCETHKRMVNAYDLGRKARFEYDENEDGDREQWEQKERIKDVRHNIDCVTVKLRNSTTITERSALLQELTALSKELARLKQQGR